MLEVITPLENLPYTHFIAVDSVMYFMNPESDGNGNNQKHPRFKRNDNGSHNYDSRSPNTRPQPKKSWSMDKRPKPRGFNNGNNRDEVTEVGRNEPEYGSVQSWGSKKSNLSHLLNFHFEPRDVYNQGGGGGRGGWRGRTRGNRGRGSRYNKEQFLQANCQFIVRENGDYTIHVVDPDTLVDWDLVEQVCTYSHGVPSCPICLYPPTVAKITRCGHIYCWVCILHYLSLGDKSWRRCPICYDAVHQKDLKSVMALETHNYCVGEQITLKLMKRKKGTVQVMPVEKWDSGESTEQLAKLTNSYSHHAKLLMASTEQVQDILDSERSALEQQLSEEGTGSLEGSYVKAALDHLQERQAALILKSVVKEDLEEQMKIMRKEEEEETKRITKALMSKAKHTVDYTSAFSDEEVEPATEEDLCGLPPGDQTVHQGQPDGEARSVSESSDGSGPVDCMIDDSMTEELVAEAAEDLALPQEAQACADPSGQVKKPSDHYYFFQAADGQHIYLHSINARCLVKENGSLENCQHEITATIVELDGVTMNEDLRHRLRYLAHLPVTCEFQVVELALKPPLVSKETLKVFSGEIEKKRRHRQKKKRDEKRLSQKIRAKENKELGIDPTAVFVPSGQHAPDALQTPPDSLETTPCGSPPVSSCADTLTTKSGASSDEGGQTAAMSFAQMLRAGKAKPKEAWPKTGSSQTTTSQEEPRPKGSDSESDNDDRVPVPVFKSSFSDAIQEALDKYKSPGKTNPDDAVLAETLAGQATKSATKKKKKQKTLLFTTTMNRAK